MKRLANKTTKQTLIANLEVADTFWERMRGLLGRDSLSPGSALLIPRCNSIHTFFMRFAIDVIFLNQEFVVVKTISGVKPGRLIWPIWRASSVIELNEGFLEQHPVRVGEELHVDHSLS